MGIYPDVTMMPLKKEYRFATRDEMLAFFRRWFNATTIEQEQVLDDYLKPLIRTTGAEIFISGDSNICPYLVEKRLEKTEMKI